MKDSDLLKLLYNILFETSDDSLFNYMSQFTKIINDCEDKENATR